MSATGVKPGSQCARVLDLLSDGKPHSFHEILRFVPCVVHSRVAELRSRGYQIECERVGDDYLYQLSTREPSAAWPQAAIPAAEGDASPKGASPASLPLTESSPLRPGLDSLNTTRSPAPPETSNPDRSPRRGEKQTASSRFRDGGSGAAGEQLALAVAA
jgi:hypothetical protein